MYKPPYMPPWDDSRKIRALLVEDGWKSPDTYDNFFSEIISGPAVYLFMLLDDSDYKSAVVAYVGMSRFLRQRICGHSVLARLRKPGYWPMRWFKPTPTHALRETESRYIAEFDPPWNIVGRNRGIDLS